MKKKRDAWKMKAAERATALREMRKELVKARARRKQDKARIRQLEAQRTDSPPPFCPNQTTSSE